MTCVECKTGEATRSGIIGETYYSNLCNRCYQGITQQNVSSSHADYNRRFDAQTHQWEIVQPYTTDGKPSRDFVSLYPDKAKRLFSAEELRKYS